MSFKTFAKTSAPLTHIQTPQKPLQKGSRVWYIRDHDRSKRYGIIRKIDYINLEIWADWSSGTGLEASYGFMKLEDCFMPNGDPCVLPTPN